MKIIFFSREYGAPTTTFIRNEVEYFGSRFNFSYLTQRALGDRSSASFITVIPFKESFFLRKARWLLWKFDILCNFYNPRYSKAVSGFIKETSPDVIHCHFAYEALALLDNIDHKNYKILIHFHGYDATEMIRKKSYVRKLKRILAAPNVYPVSCCQYFVDSLKDKLGLSKKEIKLLRCGIDLDLFSFRFHSGVPELKIFLQVSSLSVKKGHEYTLQAFAQFLTFFSGGACKLVLTGDGERKDGLMQLARELGIDQHVEFVGTVSPPQVFQLMSKADVFVHHSITTERGDMEGIPNAIIEAMAVGLPVVSTLHSGIPELVENGRNGYLVGERDVNTYAQRMADALKLGRLSVNREKVERYYNKMQHNRELESLYRSITGNDY